MKNWIKQFLILLLLATVLLLVIGCGDENNGTTAKGTSLSTFDGASGKATINIRF